MTIVLVTVFLALIAVLVINLWRLLPNSTRRCIGIITAGAVAVALLLAIGFAGANALAEETTRHWATIEYVAPVIVDGKPKLEVAFNIEGEIYCGYWQPEKPWDTFSVTQDYWVDLWHDEVINFGTEGGETEDDPNNPV